MILDNKYGLDGFVSLFVQTNYNDGMKFANYLQDLIRHKYLSVSRKYITIVEMVI